jgi:hypothetical protein
MDRSESARHDSPQLENISGTISSIPVSVDHKSDNNNHCEHIDLCGYVIGHRRGQMARFCDAPATPGSSYCARHRALCQVPPDAAAAAPIRAALVRAAERTGPAPPRLGAVALPDPLDMDDGDLAELDLPGTREWDE